MSFLSSNAEKGKHETRKGPNRKEENGRGEGECATGARCECEVGRMYRSHDPPFRLLLTRRRLRRSSLLQFGSPVTRWASIAFGAGLGIGSAYTDCSRAFDAPPSFPETSSVSQTVSQSADE
ncbi:hypothetical protein YC2023_091870 [Brassica napus]